MKKVLGYPDRWSVAPGEDVKVMVSTYGVGHYDAALVRVVCGDDSAAGPGFKEEEIPAAVAGRFAGRTQPISAGSCAVIPHAAALDCPGDLTLRATIYPTTPEKGVQGILAKWRQADGSGYALYIDAGGCLAFRLGDGAGHQTDVSSGQALPARAWCHCAASFDSRTRTVRLYQAVQASWAPGAARVERAAGLSAIGRNDVALLVAAFAGAEGGASTHGHYNGKIESPRLWHRALGLEEMAASFKEPGSPSLDVGVVGAWDFAREPFGDRILDASANGLHGKLVNLPSRAVTGSGWRGEEFCWAKRPQEYGAIHFHDDDLYDAGWKPDFDVRIPADLRSGVYAVRLRAEDDEFHMPLFVRPRRDGPKEKLAFLASTATYLAYANYQWQLQEPLAEIKNQAVLALEKSDVFLQEHPELGLSTYDKHSDGSGSRYATRLRPVLNMDVKGPMWSFNADTHILDWLEATRQPFDVIADEDLHAEGASLLAGYAAVLTGTHPEYWSTAMLAGMQAYLDRGGRLAYLGGNGFYWRCAFSPCWPGAIEVRRCEDGARYWAEEPGEYYLQFTGEYGGLWRRLGTPPQMVVGIGTVATGFDASSYYRRRPASFDPRAAFIFDGVGAAELIGNFGSMGGGAAGLETDAVDARLGTPPHALVLATSEEHSPGTMLAPEETGFHHLVMDGAQNPAVRADMVFFETPNGGAVFSTGSIAWAGSLAHDRYVNNVSRITANVVRRFLDPAPFALPR